MGNDMTSILSKEIELKLADGLVDIFNKALETRAKFPNHQLGLITQKQLMEELDIKTNTLKRWEQAGLKRYTPPVEDTRKVYYRIADILAFMGVEQ